jgi:hypothetical protein
MQQSALHLILIISILISSSSSSSSFSSSSSSISSYHFNEANLPTPSIDFVKDVHSFALASRSKP